MLSGYIMLKLLQKYVLFLFNIDTYEKINKHNVLTRTNSLSLFNDLI